jgi:subtilisin family serine protease
MLRGREIRQGSNYGKGLNVVAPIDQLVMCDAQHKTALPDDKWLDTARMRIRKGYHWKKGTTGTSNAAPYGTALAALIRSLRPDLNHREVIRIVERGATDLGSPGWDEETGYGCINFYRSLCVARDWPK